MTPDPSPVPPEAVRLAAESIVDRRMRAVHWSNSGLESHRASLMLDALPDATAALEAAAPLIRAPAELAAGKAIMQREERIQQLERHVAVLETRHAETDEAVRADERNRLTAAVTAMRDQAGTGIAKAEALDAVLELLAGDHD